MAQGKQSADERRQGKLRVPENVAPVLPSVGM